MRKKLMAVLLMTLCLSVILAGTGLFSANADTFDGKTNLAADQSMWVMDPISDSTYFDQNGIHYVDFGQGQNYAGISLKELLPRANTITLKFKASAANQAGTLKIVYGDASGAINGKALKPWEIDGGAEHFAVEIKDSAIFMYQYNIGGTYASGNQKTFTVTSALTNYIDGNEHTLALTSESSATGIDVKLTIDGTVHFDQTIATSEMNCNSVFTIGMASNELVRDEFVVSELYINADKEDPVEIDPENILFDGKNWVTGKAVEDQVILNAEKGELTVQNCDKGNYYVAYRNALPLAYTMEGKIKYTGVPKDEISDPDSRKGLRILLFSTAEAPEAIAMDGSAALSYWYQFDADGNVWLMESKNGETSPVGGDWFPDLINGAVNTFTIAVNPVFDGDASYIALTFSASGKKLYREIALVAAYAFDNYLAVGGYNESMQNLSFVLSSIKVRDKYAPETEAVDIAGVADYWSFTGPTIENGDIVAPDGAAYGATTKAAAIPAIGEVSFKIISDTHGKDWTNYVYLCLGSYSGSGWHNDMDGSSDVDFNLSLGKNYYKFYYYYANSTSETIDTATASTTNLMDEAEHEFRFVTAVVEGKYQVQLYLDGKLQATVLYENCPMQTAEQLYFFFRQTGGNGSITITEFKISAVEDLEVKTLMNEIFALPHKITADNLSDVKAQIAVLEGKYDALGTADQEKVENIGYVDFVKEEVAAFETLLADQTAAQAVIDEVAGISVPETITAENVAALKSAVESARTKYNALTDAQKAYVTNLDVLTAAEGKIASYEREAADQAAAKAVEEKIAALNVPDTLTKDNIEGVRAAVESARESYNALTEAQKAYVTNLSVLEDAEEKIAAYQPSAEDSCNCSSTVGFGTLFAATVLLSAAVFALRKKRG